LVAVAVPELGLGLVALVVLVVAVVKTLGVLARRGKDLLGVTFQRQGLVVKVAVALLRLVTLEVLVAVEMVSRHLQPVLL
jgi:hypothetical protein